MMPKKLIWYGIPDVFKNYRPSVLKFKRYAINDHGKQLNDKALYADVWGVEIFVSKKEIDRGDFKEI